MKQKIELVNPSEIELTEEKDELLDDFIDKVYHVFKKARINPDNKKVLFLRNNSRRRGLLGVQIGEDETPEDFLVYSYFANEREDDIFLSINAYSSRKISQKANEFSRLIGDDMMDCCYNLENEYNKKELDCSFSKQICHTKSNNKVNVLKRLFNKR